MTRRALLALLALPALAGCSPGSESEGNRDAPAVDLEQAAIARGLVRDPADTEIAGLYAREIDRLCIVPSGYGYRIGAMLDYGGGIACSASGTVSRVGETLTIEFGGDGACSFDARFDGENIHFPGQLPDGCAAFCSGRASFTGLSVPLLSESVAEARAMRDARGRRLCGETD